MKSLYKIFHPEIFQGSLKKRSYFEGWYFKHVSASGGDSFSVIPGISLSDDSHSFIQFIDGVRHKTSYFRYPLNEFEFSKNRLELKIGRSVFTSKGINLNIENQDLKVTGELTYSNLLHLPKSILMPGIMGWYSYVPGMECNHGVVSINHTISGTIEISNAGIDFSEGKGYIEKDWGISFPESWLWLQCNNFQDNTTSLMVSVAKIPWGRSFFIGFIGFLSRGMRTEVFATYNRSKILTLKGLNDKSTLIRIEKGDKLLEIEVQKSPSSTLRSPVEGEMINSIKESLDSKVSVGYRSDSVLEYSDSGTNAGYEETEGIFRYF